jgi:Domain of unknown function (DUF4265)
LGDEVETNGDFVLQRVVSRSGQFTYRVWFGSQDTGTRLKLVQEIEAINVFMEWSSENLLALSTRDEIESKSLAEYLRAREDEGLLEYETA